jgi:hypothetical protein
MNFELHPLRIGFALKATTAESDWPPHTSEVTPPSADEPNTGGAAVYGMRGDDVTLQHALALLRQLEAPA